MGIQEENIILDETKRNYYNSLNIFFESEDDIQELQMLKKYMSLLKKIMTELLPERTEVYHSIIKDTSLFFKQIDIDNSLEACNMFSYMLWSGVFSRNNKYGFNIKIKNTLKFLNDLGMTIMTGDGVCLNNTLLLSSILKESGYLAIGITNTIKKCDKMKYKPDIDMNMKNKLIMRLLASKSKKNSGNHICEMIQFEGNYYMYDPTNLMVFPTNGTVNTTVLNGNHSLEIKPYGSIILDELSLEDLYKIKDVFKTNISFEESSLITKELFEKDLNFFRNNKEVFTNFRKSIDDRINIIATSANNKLSLKDLFNKFFEYSDDEEIVELEQNVREKTKL